MRLILVINKLRLWTSERRLWTGAIRPSTAAIRPSAAAIRPWAAAIRPWAAAIRLWTAAILLAALAFALRAPAIEDLDGANFLHALSTYDLARHTPHFPGYPVYIALARLAAQLVSDPVAALQLPGVLAWAASVPLLFAAVRRHAGAASGVAAALVLAAVPLSLLSVGRASSDSLGVSLLVASGCLLALSLPGARDPRDRLALAWIGMLLCGISLGVRLSYAPAALTVLGAGLLLRRSSIVSNVIAFEVGIAAWAVPFAFVVGPDLPRLALDFLDGHFNSWGGTVLVTADPTGRAADWVGLLATHVLALPAEGGSPLRLLAGPALLGLAALGLTRLPRRVTLVAIGLGLPYALWLLLGQNPEKPRHLLPMVPALAVLVGIGVSHLPVLARPVLGLAAAGLLMVSMPLALEQRHCPSPEAQLASWLPAHYPREGTQLFLGPSERVLGVMAPGYRAEYAPDAIEVARRLDSFLHRPPILLVSDEVFGASGVPVHTFTRNPLVDPHRPSITLFQVSP